MDELKRLLDVAKMNYQQLGGKLKEDKLKQEEEKESARYITFFSTLAKRETKFVITNSMCNSSACHHDN